MDIVMKNIEEVPKAGLDRVMTQCLPMKRCHSAQHCDLFNIPRQTRDLHHRTPSVCVGLESPAGSSCIFMKKWDIETTHMCSHIAT